MKTRMVLLSTMVLCFGFTAGAQSFWIQLSGNRVVLDARIEGVKGDSLLVLRDRRRSFFPLVDLEKIRVIEEGSLLEGALMGAGIGAGAGAVIGSLGKGEENSRWDVGTTALTIGVIGGIIGSVIASADNGGATLDLGGMTPSKKKELILEFLVRFAGGS